MTLAREQALVVFSVSLLPLLQQAPMNTQVSGHLRHVTAFFHQNHCFPFELLGVALRFRGYFRTFSSDSSEKMLSFLSRFSGEDHLTTGWKNLTTPTAQTLANFLRYD